jgi:hypothetical protein
MLTLQRSSGLVLSLLLLAAAGAHAASLWDLNGVTFSDGGTASGVFTFDAVSRSVFDWDIVTSAADGAAGFFYTPATSVASVSQGCAIDFVAKGALQYLCLNPESPLTGLSSVLSSHSFESYPGGVRGIVSGGITDPPPGGGSSVPEPATVTLTMLAAALIFRRHVYRRTA